MIVVNSKGSEHFSNVGDCFTQRKQHNISLISGLEVIYREIASLAGTELLGHQIHSATKTAAA